eukprot:1161427-Pelagomonas_calceolata.AAC.6
MPALLQDSTRPNKRNHTHVDNRMHQAIHVCSVVVLRAGHLAGQHEAAWLGHGEAADEGAGRLVDEGLQRRAQSAGHASVIPEDSGRAAWLRHGEWQMRVLEGRLTGARWGQQGMGQEKRLVRVGRGGVC